PGRGGLGARIPSADDRRGRAAGDARAARRLALPARSENGGRAEARAGGRGRGSLAVAAGRSPGARPGSRGLPHEAERPLRGVAEPGRAAAAARSRLPVAERPGGALPDGSAPGTLGAGTGGDDPDPALRSVGAGELGILAHLAPGA